MKSWHHDYTDVQNRLPGSCLVRLGMRDHSEEHRDCECYCLDCSCGFPVLARHTTLVGCNRRAKSSALEVSQSFSRAYLESSARNFSRDTVRFLEGVQDMDRCEGELPSSLFIASNQTRPSSDNGRFNHLIPAPPHSGVNAALGSNTNMPTGSWHPSGEAEADTAKLPLSLQAGQR